MAEHGLALLLLAGVLAAWVAVQQAWRRSFTDECSDPDALAGRLGCAGAACRRPCARARSGAATTEEEER